MEFVTMIYSDLKIKRTIVIYKFKNKITWYQEFI